MLFLSLGHAWQTQTFDFGIWIADCGINIKTVHLVHFLLLRDTLSRSFGQIQTRGMRIAPQLNAKKDLTGQGMRI